MTPNPYLAVNAANCQYRGVDCHGNLPFTGFDLGITLILAVVFTLAGLAIRKAARR